LCFFFSSRRRHTRSYGDWSSDVCSSDLVRTTDTSGMGNAFEIKGHSMHGRFLLGALILFTTGCMHIPLRNNTANQARTVSDLYQDRKSTRLNSSHRTISYAVFCLKKKKK